MSAATIARSTQRANAELRSARHKMICDEVNDGRTPCTLRFGVDLVAGDTRPGAAVLGLSHRSTPGMRNGLPGTGVPVKP